MAENAAKNLNQYRLRARLPQFFRYAALFLLLITVLAVVVGFYRERNRTPFMLKSEHTQLSTDVIAEVSGYERLESDGDVAKYFIKADTARTFSDNHQELQNAYVRIYDDAGNPADQFTADRALYVPAENKNFTAYLNGNVHIETRDALKVVTNNVTYTRSSQTADADEAVQFERENVRGKAFGARVFIAEKHVDLLKDVEIETFESPEMAASNVRYSKINSNSASFDQAANRINLNGSVAINVDSNTRRSDVKAERAVAFLDGADAKSRQLKKIELFDNVQIVSNEAGKAPTTIDSGYVLFDKDADRFELKNGAHIVTNANETPTDIKSSEAVYERTALKFTLKGDASVTQGGEFVKGDSISANLFANQKLKDTVVRGGAFLRQTTVERTTQVAANELNALYLQTGQLQNANAVGQSTAELIPNGNAGYSHVTMTAPQAIHLIFKGEGLLEKMQTDGRTTVRLDVPDTNADAANKRVTADTVNTYFNDSGKDIRRTEAVGNAELYIEPRRASAQNYKTTINAPRFDCDFFDTGNSARVCVGGKKTKTVRVPTVAVPDHGTQTLIAEQLTANFSPRTKDVERFDASGSTKFTELERNAIADQLTFTQTDQILRLRGGEPTVWDSKSRAKGREIDWDTSANHSNLRGSVSTTYYTRRSMGDAAPFGQSEKPVFVTSETAEFDHNAQIGVYRGNARGWQDDNYVRADQLTFKQKEGELLADGSVQSMLYDTKTKRGGKESSAPVFATAKAMSYERDSRILRYRKSVDIRQGTDRITSETADVYLGEKNELHKTVAETSVVITQPGRRATGDWAQYTAEDEIAIIRGNPAVVNDAESGGSQSSQITVYMRENRFVGDGKARQNPNGRVKSTYKVKSGQ